ncbi:MAG: SURF1 family protein [Gemmatimonadaceae bacterium]|nr:SURF1 family protein [Gemmatimonadaceae bacterium]
MNVRTAALVVVSIVVAGACITLGIWQLDRRADRRAFNSVLARRLAAPPAPLSELPTDTGNAHYRRVVVDGEYDYSSEIVLTSRSRQGSPGVHILTPLVRRGNDTAVLVNRGWIYSPDGTTADLKRWRETGAARGIGYVETFSSRKGAIRSPRQPRAFRWLDRTAMQSDFPYPIAPYYVVLLKASDRDTSGSIPPRLGVPILDQGPHGSYAFQWFSFAAISIIGMSLLMMRTRAQRATDTAETRTPHE